MNRNMMVLVSLYSTNLSWFILYSPFKQKKKSHIYHRITLENKERERKEKNDKELREKEEKKKDSV
jgi:hypothetical protein